MIIAQIVEARAPEYERKLQRIDFAALHGLQNVQIAGERADIKHVYGSRAYVAQAKRFFARREEITPFSVPEAVDDVYFLDGRTSSSAPTSGSTIGSFSRPTVTPVIEQTMARIHRFRDDVTWRVFTSPPTPQEIASLDAWVDPAVKEDDYDGFVAEAQAAGVIVIAARTAVNDQRCEKGRTGLLVPPCDSNEFTHAILTALFKPEIARARSEASRQTVSKYRSRHRTRVLLQIYERLIA